MHKEVMRIILPILLIISSLPASAIVVRHDVTDKKYNADATDFAPLATLYVDGAHGSLIKPDWIVTAAHATFCISPGSYLRLNNGYHKVESVFVHKDYQPSKSHDIALIKLVNPINDVKPANLYEQTNELAKITWFIGVGGTGNGLTGQIVDNYENGGVLRKAQNQIEQAEGPLLKFKFDRDDVALPLEGVSGSGDSGGPAYSTIDGTHYLLGISSRVEGGDIGEYGVMEVYSRVSFFTSWIEKITAGEEALQQQLAFPKLQRLPAGLTEQILPQVCAVISLKPNAV
ncbi:MULTISPECIES: trypsin-like serine protease [Enterobacterales]|uniref:trypsin-like serine protease n=1 Tax=Enterobacterales TaxID=91347 RepID=UPI001BD4C931|nr:MULTISPECIES: trypsin-like serine protease [Enterobacterales]